MARTNRPSNKREQPAREPIEETPSEQLAEKPDFWQNPWMALLPLALAALAFYPNLQNDYVYFDDTEAILNNTLLRNPSLHGFFSGQNLGMYAPITWITYWGGFLISGEDAFGYHLLGWLLHALNAALVFLVMRKLVDPGWLAAAVAVLFAVHPIQAEAVCWAAALSTVLFTTFYLASLLTYLQWRQAARKPWAWYAASIGLFVLACLSKSAAVTLPLVLIAVDFLRERPQWRALLLNKLPYLVFSVIFGLYTYSTREQAGFDATIHNTAYSAFDRILMVSQTLFFYPFKLLIPFKYAVAYPFPKSESVWPWTYYAAPFALAGTAFGVWYFFRRNYLVLLGLALYILPLSIMLPHQTIGSLELRSDRYVYFSSIGIFLLLGLALGHLSRPARNGVLAVLTALLMLLAWQQAKVWKNGVTLFGNCVKWAPESNLCQCNLAYSELINHQYEAAVKDYTTALALQPDMYECYNGRGQAYFSLKKVPEALADFNQAVAAGIVTPKLFLNRGKCLLMLNRPNEALPDLDKSLELEPNSADAYYFRGASREKTGDAAGAIQDYTEAIRRHPSHTKALVNRGMLRFNDAKYDLALADLSEALKYTANLPMIWNNRANIYLKLAQPEKALADAEQALRLDPNYAQALQTRGQLRVQLGQTTAGQADLEKAQQLLQK